MKNLARFPYRYLRIVWHRRVKPLFDVRDDRLLRGEFESSLHRASLLTARCWQSSSSLTVQ